MNLGNWQLDTVCGGRMRLDGGTMFGVVPKALWARRQPADEQNRIRLATNCVLARNGEHTLLVDTGYGGKCSDKEREQMDLDSGERLLESLAHVQLTPDDIDTVVLSHLHFDHAGGSTRPDGQGRLVPTFPRATYVAGRIEWEVATSGADELRGAYPLENLLPLAESGQLRLVEDGEEIVPGLKPLLTGGHTRGHHAIVFESDGQTAIYLGDLCPTHSHMPAHWGMAYDTHPLDTRRRKPQILGQAADAAWLVLFDHDPDLAAARIARDPKREFVVIERFATL